MTKITASIVLFNNSEAECRIVLDCLLASPVDRIYLIDHSGDDKLAVLQKFSTKITYIRHSNTGYGAGHNIAIQQVAEQGSDYHLILNADIIFDKNVVPALQQYMEEHPDTGLMMPRVFYPDGKEQYLCKLLPTPFDLIVRRFLPKGVFRKAQDRFLLKSSSYDKTMNVPWLSGCFMFFRTSVLKETGGFDERFFMYAEDIDISRRTHQISKTIYYPEVSIVHAHKAASKTNWKMLFIHITNVSRYFCKWGWLFDKERKRINLEASDQCKK